MTEIKTMTEIKQLCNGCHLNRNIELFTTNGKEYKTCQKCRDKKKKVEKIDDGKIKCSKCETKRLPEDFIDSDGKPFKTCNYCRKPKVIKSEEQENKIECTGCKTKKTIEHFMNDKGKQCKTCNTCRSYDNKFKKKEYNPVEQSAKNKEYYQKNKDGIIEKKKEYIANLPLYNEVGNKQCKKCHKYLELTKFTEESAANCNECKEKDKAYKKEKRAKAKTVEETD